MSADNALIRILRSRVDRVLPRNTVLSAPLLRRGLGVEGQGTSNALQDLGRMGVFAEEIERWQVYGDEGQATFHDGEEGRFGVGELDVDDLASETDKRGKEDEGDGEATADRGVEAPDTRDRGEEDKDFEEEVGNGLREEIREGMCAVFGMFAFDPESFHMSTALEGWEDDVGDEPQADDNDPDQEIDVESVAAF